VKAEILRLEREAGNLVRFLAEGGESATVRSELQGIENALQGLRLELAGREAMPSVPPRVHPTWMRAKLERLDELLRQEPAQAKVEIANIHPPVSFGGRALVVLVHTLCRARPPGAARRRVHEAGPWATADPDTPSWWGT
jgi:hypothetical protein